MVDPYSYLSTIRIPTLLIFGTNDQFWALDAHRLYWDQIRGPKLIRMVPNVGHNLGGGVEAAASVAFFSRCLTGAIPGGLPKLSGQDSRRKQQVPWYAGSKSLEFQLSAWRSHVKPGANPRKVASFIEYRFEAGSSKASFTSVVTIRK